MRFKSYNELMNKTLVEIIPSFSLPKSEVYLTYISKIENNKILAKPFKNLSSGTILFCLI